MMTELMLDTCKYAQCLCWLPADNVIPCVVTSMLPFGETQKRKIALQRRSVTRSQPNSRPCRVAKLRTLPPRSCLGAFRPPAVGVRGETIIPAAENLHRSRHYATTAEVQ
jgi:hypothetical protein